MKSALYPWDLLPHQWRLQPGFMSNRHETDRPTFEVIHKKGLYSMDENLQQMRSINYALSSGQSPRGALNKL